jgi:hypothetical protein
LGRKSRSTTSGAKARSYPGTWRHDTVENPVQRGSFPLAADVDHGSRCGYEIGLADVVARFFFLDYSAYEFCEIFV